VPTGSVADHAVDAHWRGRLDDDDAVQNQMTELQRATESWNSYFAIGACTHGEGKNPLSLFGLLNGWNRMNYPGFVNFSPGNP